jgi:hypothetical protein
VTTGEYVIDSLHKAANEFADAAYLVRVSQDLHAGDTAISRGMALITDLLQVIRTGEQPNAPHDS